MDPQEAWSAEIKVEQLEPNTWVLLSLDETESETDTMDEASGTQ